MQLNRFRLQPWPQRHYFLLVVLQDLRDHMQEPITGLEITAGQRTMSELIWEVDRSTFCLTGQVDRSHLIVLKNKIN